MSIDLSALPAPAVIDSLSFDSIVSEIKADLISRFPAAESVLAYESDPLVKLIEAFAYRELTLRARINDAARAVMLAYASAADLDHLAALLDTARLTDSDGTPESDDRLRARTQIAMEGYSTAGPSRSYIYHALSASAQVRDAYVSSPTPGTVRVVILAEPSADNVHGVPAAALLESVAAALNAEDVRPLSDEVIVEAANVIDYTVNAVIVTLAGPDTGAVMTAANAACQAYVDGLFRLGNDVTISGLHAALHQPGVMRVDLLSPAAGIAIASDQAARCSSLTIVSGGTGQ